MTWWTQWEFSYEEYSYNQEFISGIAKEITSEKNTQWDIINSTNTYKVTGENLFVVEVGFNKNITEKEVEEHKVDVRDTMEDEFAALWDITLSKYTNIWASFWDYIKRTAIITLIIAIIAIAVYIAYAFSGSVWGINSLSFAAITLVTLFHDVLISTGFYIVAWMIFPQFQIDTFFITALLTILWYSINDTIVVFDRIRSNLKDFWGKWKNLEEIVELSVSQSLTRSIYTSITLAFVLICILVFGPESISGFTLTMLFGTIIGTFSSIYIASPLLYELHKNAVLSEYVKKEELSEEEKMVV